MYVYTSCILIKRILYTFCNIIYEWLYRYTYVISNKPSLIKSALNDQIYKLYNLSTGRTINYTVYRYLLQLCTVFSLRYYSVYVYYIITNNVTNTSYNVLRVVHKQCVDPKRRDHRDDDDEQLHQKQPPDPEDIIICDWESETRD